MDSRIETSISTQRALNAMARCHKIKPFYYYDNVIVDDESEINAETAA